LRANANLFLPFLPRVANFVILKGFFEFVWCFGRTKKQQSATPPAALRLVFWGVFTPMT
jgi:hypothetical protein